jgi:hypothetical protein
VGKAHKNLLKQESARFGALAFYDAVGVRWMIRIFLVEGCDATMFNRITLVWLTEKT